MAVEDKKYILMKEELKNSSVGLFFNEIGFEIECEVIEKRDYQFIIDDYLPEMVSLPRIQINEKIAEECLSQVRGRICPDMFKSSSGKKLLQSYFNDGQELDIVDRYSKELKNIYTYKIHEYLNVGYFIDTIVVDGYKAQFDIEKLRSYLNHLLKFTFKRLEKNINQFPIDLSYSHDGAAFAIQVTFSVERFEGVSEVEQIKKDCEKFCNFFDVTYLGKRQRVSISAVIYKDSELENTNSSFYSEILSKLTSNKQIKSERFSALLPREDFKYVTQKAENLQAKKLSLARKLVHFIEKYRKSEPTPIPVQNLELTDVHHYLTFFPIQSLVASCDEEVLLFILKMLKESQLNQGIKEYINKIANSNLDNQIGNIQQQILGKSLADVEEMIRFSNDSSNEEAINKVKGWLEDLNDGHSVITGDPEVSIEEKWEIKKLEINKQLEEELFLMNSNGKNIAESDILRITSNVLGVENEEIRFLVKDVIEEVVSSELVNNQKLEEVSALKFFSGKVPGQDREKLEQQIVKMKRLIDHMKNEIIKLKNEKSELPDTGELKIQYSEAELNQLKLALSKSIDIAKGKDTLIEKQRIDYDSLIKNRDLKIEFLESRIEEFKNVHANNRELASEEKLKNLEVENKSLLARLELANKKMSIISENLGNKEQDEFAKKDREIESLKNNMLLAQGVIERFKQEKLDFESKLQEDKENIRKLKEERELNLPNSKSSKLEANEKDTMIANLNSEKRTMEEKYKLLTIELKKAEQKLKFSSSLLESSSKKQTTGSGNAQKTADAYAKQLEQAYSRLTDTSSELTEKKKEILKLRQESSLLTTKLTELEKKLTTQDKKVA